MLTQLDQIERQAIASLSEVNDQESLSNNGASPIWVEALLLMQVFDAIGQVPKEDRPSIGKRANQVKQALEARIG